MSKLKLEIENNKISTYIDDEKLEYISKIYLSADSSGYKSCTLDVPDLEDLSTKVEIDVEVFLKFKSQLEKLRTVEGLRIDLIKQFQCLK